MSFGSAIAGFVRGTLIAAATGGAVLGLLAIFHPFAPPSITATLTIPPGSSAAQVLQQQIAAARTSLRQAQQALDDVKGGSLVVSSAPAGDTGEAQLAAAIERRDLARRHAQAIRDAIKSGADLGALADVRDSVVIGQLLAQQAALESQIAEQGARFKSSHPVMLALKAQKDALVAQVKAEAASIASALETEARLDDAQIRLLQSEGAAAAPPAASSASGAPDASALGARRDAEQNRLDQLLDAYFSLPAASNGASTISAHDAGDLLSPLNVFVVAVAFIAAVMFQIGFALRRRRLQREALDMALWTNDQDHETPAPPVAVVAEPRFRKAS